ncbi:MAG: hypothetical protein IKO40_05195 [Kiritimatiellae bacterium]|nr:hypothetical protein [Kiritimatiellia bacterium]
MTNEETIIRKNHEKIYRPLVDAFFNECEKHGYTDEELSAVPSLFLPACGSLYATSLVKLAVIGQETLRWGEGLSCDMTSWREGKFDVQSSFDTFQNEGPSEWQNRFWAYHFSVLEKVYERKGLLDDHNTVLDGIAWSNRFAVELNGTKIGDGEGQIKAERFWPLREIADEVGLSSFELFIRVFRPDVILYSCHNDAMGSDAVFKPFAELVEKIERDGFKIWTWKLGRTWILQTWHPSYLAQYKGVSTDSFAAAIREEMIKRKVFAPIGAAWHYDSRPNAQIPIFAQQLDEESTRIAASESEIGDKELSYRLLGALALELRKQRATMTARQGGLLLNEVKRFQEHNYLFAPGGHGPCAVAAAAYRFFDARGTEEDRLLADAVAGAFTTVHGTYAYE